MRCWRCGLVGLPFAVAHVEDWASAKTCSRIATASSISSSVTSSDGASRSARRRHRVDDEAAVQGEVGGDLRRRCRRARPRSAARGRAPRPRRRRCCSALGERSPPRLRPARARPRAPSRRARRGRPRWRAAGRRRSWRGRRARTRAATSARAQHAPIGTPLPSALAMVTTSGCDAEVLEAEPLAGAAEAGLHLVDHEQEPALVAQAAHALEVLGGRGVHAALALHGLEQHRGHRAGRAPPRARRGRPTRRGGSPRAAAGTPRASAAARWRASVASVRPWNEPYALTTTWRPAAAPLAGELDRALVGLGAGVAEEHLAAVSRRRR